VLRIFINPIEVSIVSKIRTRQNTFYANETHFAVFLPNKTRFAAPDQACLEYPNCGDCKYRIFRKAMYMLIKLSLMYQIEKKDIFLIIG
jgi:hypothetical protein